MTSGRAVGIVSVNVGRPRLIGVRQAQAVRSAIDKQPVRCASLRLDTIQLEGDRQADPRVHGGPDKAVFVYPVEHVHAWERELGDPRFRPGAIGENLTTEGLTEDQVSIGDVWGWGDALVQVCQPREPCFKLAMRMERPEMVRLFEESSRSGWYLRVLCAGVVPTRGEIEVVERDQGGLTVRHASRLLRRGAPPADIEAAASHPDLALAWRRALQRRLRSLDTAAT